MNVILFTSACLVDGEFARITLDHHDFGKSYTLKLQQNYGVSSISSNSLLI